MNRVLIIGAGHAGGTVAAQLRQYGHGGPITLVGEEPVAPYQRPPLSKAYLKDAVSIDSLKLRPDSFYSDQNIDLKLGRRAQSLDRDKKIVVLDSGEQLAYDHLILATGAGARQLSVPGAELKNIYTLRNASDAEALKSALRPGQRLAVIGAGYVGLEVAASAIEMGARVTVIEREARVLARVACEPLSSFFQKFHLAKGVEIICDAQVSSFEGDQKGISAVHLADGRRIACDVAIVGIGATPNDALARSSGLICENNGIVVDGAARTSDPSIYAIGDVTWRPMPLYDGRMFRLESVPNAIEQAKQAACAITGRPLPAPEVPWFWSDQYDLKLQIAGVPFDADRIVVRGAPELAKFAIFHLRGQRLLAVEAINAPAEFIVGKQLISTGRNVNLEKLANATASMKEVAE